MKKVIIAGIIIFIIIAVINGVYAIKDNNTTAMLGWFCAIVWALNSLVLIGCLNTSQSEVKCVYHLPERRTEEEVEK